MAKSRGPTLFLRPSPASCILAAEWKIGPGTKRCLQMGIRSGEDQAATKTAAIWQTCWLDDTRDRSENRTYPSIRPPIDSVRKGTATGYE